MTKEKFNKISLGKESKDIRKELRFIQVFKNSTWKITFSFPHREGKIKDRGKVTQKYIDGKYIHTILTTVRKEKVETITLWNEKEKRAEQWRISIEGKLLKMICEPTKTKNRYYWSGDTDVGKYKAYVDYTPRLISWEGKYYRDGKFESAESGNAVPVK